MHTTLSSFTRLKDKIQFHYLPDEIKESITQKKKSEEYKALLASSNPTKMLVSKQEIIRKKSLPRNGGERRSIKPSTIANTNLKSSMVHSTFNTAKTLKIDTVGQQYELKKKRDLLI